MAGHSRGKHCSLTLISVIAVAIGIGTASAGSSGRLDSTPEEVFNSMRGSFQPAKAKAIHALYQWELSGAQGGKWWIHVNDGKCTMGKGKINNPNVIFIARARDWVAVSNGQLSGTWAYFTGRLRIRGDQAIARKLGEMFP